VKFKKVAQFSDIHFGRKNNSEIHNQDCINYINWFCEQVKNDPDMDCIFFLGDWHEHRSAINAFTLHHSQIGANILNELGLPIYFVTGNHDLATQNTRDVYTTVIFEKLSNFTIVNEPVILEDNKCVLAPFLFESEYPEFFKKYSKYEIFAGHFEFKGFVLTGEHVIKEHGPDPKDYKKPKHIFSGHYHRRQSKNNIHYIGNTFPADFSDVNDTERGMATYDFENDEIKYIDWLDCPKYIKADLSDVLTNSKSILAKNARVKIIVDQDITLSENNKIKQVLSEKYNLREIVLEEQVDNSVELTDIEQEVEDLHLEGVNQIVPELIKRIKSEKISSDKLVDIYRKL
jgi:DNA repair exonuclease SbcCD nuclease subunit